MTLLLSMNYIATIILIYVIHSDGFIVHNNLFGNHGWQAIHRRQSYIFSTSLKSSSSQPSDPSIASLVSVDEASRILSDWDKFYNSDRSNPTIVPSGESASADNCNDAGVRSRLRESVLLLTNVAAKERLVDTTKGRCMLGICATSAAEGLQTLKSWVSALQLPRGLLHGMDRDGVPIELDGAVYIKYNTGGCVTFADIRNSGMGFDAIWRPGDALLEPYDGSYRGCYFQVELQDGVFRQYLLPLDLFLD